MNMLVVVYVICSYDCYPMISDVFPGFVAKHGFCLT